MRGPGLIDELQNLLDGLAARVQQSVAVDDAWGRLLAVSRHYGDADGYRVKLILERKIPPAYREFFAPYIAQGVQSPVRVPSNKDLSIMARIGYPIYIEDDLVAFLWFIDLGRALPEQLIESYTSRIKELLAERLDKEAAKTSDQRSERVRDLLLGKTPRPLAPGSIEGLSEAQNRFIVLSHYCDGNAANVSGAKDFMDQLPRAAADQGFEMVANLTPDGLTVAVYVRELGPSADQDMIIDRIVEEASRFFSSGDQRANAQVGFGLSSLGEVPMIRDLYAQSAVSAFLSRHLSHAPRVFAWSHVTGMARALAIRTDAPMSPPMRALGDLLRDAESFAFDTIGAMLHAGPFTGDAAELLSVHRTTLHYRIQQIQSATGLNFTAAADRYTAFDLWLRFAVERSPVGQLLDELNLA